jgi:hypothetical protein
MRGTDVWRDADDLQQCADHGFVLVGVPLQRRILYKVMSNIEQCWWHHNHMYVASRDHMYVTSHGHVYVASRDHVYVTSRDHV